MSAYIEELLGVPAERFLSGDSVWNELLHPDDRDRAVDETGYVQPTRAAFTTVRGKGTDYHYNHIRAWHIARSGQVTFAVDV